jgi:hypothetical protein
MCDPILLLAFLAAITSFLAAGTLQVSKFPTYTELTHRKTWTMIEQACEPASN